MQISSTTPTKRVNKAVKSTARTSRGQESPIGDATAPNGASPVVSSTGNQGTAAATAISHSSSSELSSTTVETTGSGKWKTLGDPMDVDMEKPSSGGGRRSSADSDSIIEIPEAGAGNGRGSKRASLTRSIDKKAPNGFTQRLKNATVSTSSSSASIASSGGTKLDDFLTDTTAIVGMFRTQKSAVERDMKYQMNYRLFERSCQGVTHRKDFQAMVARSVTVQQLSKFRRLQQLLALDPSLDRPKSGTSSIRASQDSAKTSPKKATKAAANGPTSSAAADKTTSAAAANSEPLSILSDPEMSRLVQKYNAAYRPVLSHKVDEKATAKNKRVTLTWSVEKIELPKRSHGIAGPDAVDFVKNISFYELFGSRVLDKEASWILIETIKGSPSPVTCTLTDFDHGAVYSFKVRFVDHDGLKSPFSDKTTVRI